MGKAGADDATADGDTLTDESNDRYFPIFLSVNLGALYLKFGIQLTILSYDREGLSLSSAISAWYHHVVPVFSG